MNFLPEEFDEILNIFREEGDEIVQRFNSHLIRLEENPDDGEVIANLFQDAHSLKGAARMIGFYNIQNIAHKIEDILSLIKDKKLELSKDLFNTVYKASDFLLFLIANSVKAKEDYVSPEVEICTNNLISIIESVNSSQISESPSSLAEDKLIADTDINTFSDEELEKFLKQTENITALVLESLFVINCYKSEEKETHISILVDNFNSLSDIFNATKFSELSRQINETQSLLKRKLSNLANFDQSELLELKNIISGLVRAINSVFLILSVPQISSDLLVEEPDFQTNKSDGKIPNIPLERGDPKVRKLFDDLLNSLSRLKLEEIAVKQSKEAVKSLLEEDFTDEIIQIYRKIFDILELINKLKIKPENDIITILTQSVNITKKIILHENDGESEDLSLLLQRLSIIEQMIDITDVSSGSIVKANASSSVEPEFQKVQDFFKTFEIGTIKTLRVDTTKLDSLISQTGELIINGIKTRKHLQELEEINLKINEWNILQKRTMNYIKYYDKKNMSKFESIKTANTFVKQITNMLQAHSGSVSEIVTSLNDLYKHINEDDIKLNHIIAEIEDIVKSIRVLPLGTVFHMFPRMIRDIATNSNKEVELFISGSETTVDKKVIEEIKMPLIHILRNSVDHGIEHPEDRVRNRKPRAGKIHLSAKCEENKIIIEVEDDGFGINLKKVREKALQKGLLTYEELNAMSDEQVMNLIFWPGFSTGDQITEISGRGIGLDVVQTKITQLNGRVKMFSEINKGAKVTIELPVSMSTVKAFIVQVGDQQFAIPMSAIKVVQWINEEKIFYKDGYKTILFENQPIPIMDLAEVLNIKRTTEPVKKNITIAIVESENAKIAYVVDKLLGDQEILHKKLSPPIFKLKNIAGITNLASGELCLILNVSELINGCLGNLERLSVQSNKFLLAKKSYFEPSKYKILIVDDSKITLILLEKIAKQRGYSTISFTNALNALQELKKERYDLIVSDVEMPKMSGIEFVKAIRTDEMLSEIPVLLISTKPWLKLKSSFDNIKINAFINKMNFNKEEFLDKVEEILR